MTMTDNIERPSLTSVELQHAGYIEDIARNVGYFAEHPYRHLGDRDSGHGVLFGSLAPYGEVALKPFTVLQRAEHEKRMLEHVKSIGFDTIEPLDIASEGLFAYLISRYDDDIRHLGQVNWNENVASRRLHRELTPAVNQAGNLAGQLHSKGVTHGDMQAKNVMLRKTGTPVLVDLESGVMNRTGHDLEDGGDRDIASFGLSVIRRGLLADRSLRYRLGYLGDELIDPALEIEGTVSESDRRKAIQSRIAESYLAGQKHRHPAGRALKRVVA